MFCVAGGKLMLAGGFLKRETNHVREKGSQFAEKS